MRREDARKLWTSKEERFPLSRNDAVGAMHERPGERARPAQCQHIGDISCRDMGNTLVFSLWKTLPSRGSHTRRICGVQFANEQRAQVDLPDPFAVVFETDSFPPEGASNEAQPALPFDVYVRLNPVRAGLVNEADAWPHQGELNELRW